MDRLAGFFLVLVASTMTSATMTEANYMLHGVDQECTGSPSNRVILDTSGLTVDQCYVAALADHRCGSWFEVSHDGGGYCLCYTTDCSSFFSDAGESLYVMQEVTKTTSTSATTTKTTTTVTTTTLSLTAGRARLNFGKKGEVPRAKAIDACDRKGKHLCTLWELLDQEDLVKGKGCFRKMKLWTSSSSSTCAQETENGAFLVSYDGCSKVRTSCEPPEAHAMFMCCDGPAPPERRLRGTATREIPTVLV